MKELKKMLENAIDNTKGVNDEQMQYKYIVATEYVDKDIENFVDYINNSDSDWKVEVENDEKSEYHEKVAKIVRNLHMIAHACKTIYIDENRQDFKALAGALKDVSDIMFEVADLKRDEKKDTKDDIEKEIEKLIKKLKSMM